MVKILRIVSVIILTLLGAMTVFMASSVIFDLFGMAEKQGNYVLFVVYANLACGLIYLISAYRILRRKRDAVSLLVLATTILVITSIAFIIYVKQGGLFEEKTFFALSFRTGITALLAWMSHYIRRFGEQPG